MFQLEKSSVFFEGMAQKHPEVVQNIEIVHKNKISLDITYHNPKYFILNLNNSLRSLLFFIEMSIKNSPKWLMNCVKSYRDDNRDEYEILKKLRDVSAHQSLIFPKESLVTGLYRIRSSQEYVAKIGIGDLKGPGSYSWDLAMKDTDEIFHDLLVFHSMAFMDLEHSAIGECLGVTRMWYFHVKFSTKTTSYDKTIDVYGLFCKFSQKLLDIVCNAYAEHVGIKFDTPFHYESSEFNCINTLLEVDLYPSLFEKWWESDMAPLNFGVRVNKGKGDAIAAYDKAHLDSYEKLCKSPEEYKGLLIKYHDMEFDEYFSDDNVDEFHSFVYFNHWHFKNSFHVSLMDTPIEPSEIMQLQRLGKVFLDEYHKGKLCTISSTGKNFKEHLDALSKKI